MTVPVETALAEKTAMALKALPALYDFKVYANWGKGNARRPFDENGCRDPRFVEVNVRPRRHEEFTSATATVDILLTGSIDFASRVMRVQPEDAYLEVVGLLEDWHGSIAAVKRALGSEFFDPVGMRLDGGGEWGIGEGKSIDFTIPFTVKGRVRKGNRT